MVLEELWPYKATRALPALQPFLLQIIILQGPCSLESKSECIPALPYNPSANSNALVDCCIFIRVKANISRPAHPILQLNYSCKIGLLGHQNDPLPLSPGATRSYCIVDCCVIGFGG